MDETFLDRKEDSERIKSLSTSKYYKIEAKGQDRQEIEFFGKFIKYADESHLYKQHKDLNDYLLHQNCQLKQNLGLRRHF